MKILAPMGNPDALDEAILLAAGWRMPWSLPAEERAERNRSAEARETQIREALSTWVDEEGQVHLEFDLGADPPTARVLRRDGKEEIGGMLFTAAEAAAIRSRAANIGRAAEGDLIAKGGDPSEGGAA